MSPTRGGGVGSSWAVGAAWAASLQGEVCAWRGETERFWFSFRVNHVAMLCQMQK